MKKILYFMFLMGVITSNQVNVYADEEDTSGDLVIDIDDSNNESYEGINGNYKNFNFFSTKNIEKIEGKQQKEQEMFIERQNIIILNEVDESNDLYEKIQNKIFETPINSIPTKAKQDKDSSFVPYIFMGGISMSLVMVLAYLYYQKKREGRLLEDDENYSIYSE